MLKTPTATHLDLMSFEGKPYKVVKYREIVLWD